MKRVVVKAKYFYNAATLRKNLAAVKSPNYINNSSDYKKNIFFHNGKTPDEELLKSLSTDERCFNSTIIEWDPRSDLESSKEEREEIFPRINVYPELKDPLEQHVVYVFLGDGTRITESD